jgi:cysteine-rich repeat protein
VGLLVVACSDGAVTGRQRTGQPANPGGGFVDPGGSVGGGPATTPGKNDGVIVVAGTNGMQPVPPGCGDGTLTSDEACDDSNNVSGDGCNEACLQVEPGFSCASPGKACREIARCGDGIVAASEGCDDANLTAGDGCS